MTWFFNYLITVALGIIQGITEWLPISSTGHLLLFNELFPLKEITDDFRDLFMVVIQFGSILAVLVLFWNKLCPFGPGKDKEKQKSTWLLWAKVLVAAVPAGIIGLLLDDLIEDWIYGIPVLKCAVIAGALIVYGIAFIVIERVMAKKPNRVETLEELSFKDALIIGCFQVLALIPGTSRSGSTIIGARTVGISRTAAAEFSFFLALPVMLGASALKIVKYIFFAENAETGERMIRWFSGAEIGLLLVGMAISFAVSLVVIKFLMEFVRRHSFEPFGWYRIGLGAVVLVYMTIRYIILK